MKKVGAKYESKEASKIKRKRSERERNKFFVKATEHSNQRVKQTKRNKRKYSTTNGIEHVLAVLINCSISDNPEGYRRHYASREP